MSANHESANFANSRSQTWWMLSRFYHQRPEATWLIELRHSLAAVLETGVPDDGDDRGQALYAGVRTLLNCLGDPGETALVTRLGLEYTRLFRGIEEHYGPPPPYEGIHRGEALMGPIAMDVRHHYEAAGLGAIEPGTGPKDHLSVELRFLSLLCFREAEARRANNTTAAQQRSDQQRAFLDAHLLAWIPRYMARIAADSREPFYTAVAQLTLAFAQQDRAGLDEPLGIQEAA